MRNGIPANCTECRYFHNCQSCYGSEGCFFRITPKDDKILFAEVLSKVFGALMQKK